MRYRVNNNGANAYFCYVAVSRLNKLFCFASRSDLVAHAAIIEDEPCHRLAAGVTSYSLTVKL